MEGTIIKGIGGFYYVHDGRSRVYECRAKGIFRNRGEKPLVGDRVTCDILDEAEGEASVTSICERKNCLIRPAVANVDQALGVFALRDPEPNYNLLDRFLVMMERQFLAPVLVFNKCDLATGKEKEACAAVSETVTAVQKGEERSGGLKKKLQFFADVWRGFVNGEKAD